MHLSDTRILTTHTGSLPRPAALVGLYAARLRGEPVDEDVLERMGREATAHSVARQIEAGLDVINNGEQQRESFVLYLRRRLSGFGGEGARGRFSDLDRYPEFTERQAAEAAARERVTNTAALPQAIGPVTYTGEAELAAELDAFDAALAPHRDRITETFFTAPSPGLLASIVQNVHYPSFEDYLAALRDALRVEYHAIAARGHVLQLDCPDLAMERHGSFRDRPLKDFLGFVEAVVAALNEAIEGIPPEWVRLHVCWGNYEGPHDDDVPLEDILPVLRGLKVGGFVLPFGNARHAHEYRVLERLPLGSDQVLVAGVIDTLSNVVEHPEGIAERLERIAAALGDPHRLLAGTDCGFDTSAGNGRVAPDVAWGKLRALSEGAARASERLFPVPSRPLPSRTTA